MQHVQNVGLNLVNIISDDNFFYNSTGDGFILIFFSEIHYYDAYLFILSFNRIMSIINNKIKCEKNIKFSFGIGAESGEVFEIKIKSMQQVNYLGNVINNAARIEAETKTHGRANIIIGEELNQLLCHNIFNINYRELMEKTKDTTNEVMAKNNIDNMNRYNQELLLSYIFEHNLKGIDNPIPLFRVSPTLADENKQGISRVIGLLVNNRTSK